ncbi:MAG TPA: signal peptidase I [Pyrinomonadaceae bacterium]|jgi:signal peptidase I
MRAFLVCAILAFCCLATGCKGFGYKVTTENMSPALNIGDAFTVNPFADKSEPIKRFDIVVFQAPEETKKISGESGDVRYVMRVIGLPNEKLEIKDNKIYIDDKLLDEPFEKFVDEKDARKNFRAIVIPENEYFLMGDNRPHSNDSRYYKPATIKREDIYGKVFEIFPEYYKKS